MVLPNNIYIIYIWELGITEVENITKSYNKKIGKAVFNLKTSKQLLCQRTLSQQNG